MLLITFGALLIVSAVAFLFNEVSLEENNSEFWVFMLLMQSVLFIFLGIRYLIYRKYYIQIDDSIIKYRWIGDKESKKIDTGNIADIKIDTLNIELLTNGNKINFNLEQLDYNKIQQIKGLLSKIRA